MLLQWAATQNNLGNALQALGERESGTARLGKAVAAYRAALKGRTRERAPLDWAMTQDNLGAALQTPGRRESDTARLEEAVGAHRAALDVFEAAGAAFDCAIARENLVLVEQMLLSRRSGA